MRIIGEIPHPLFKISVFKMEQRITVKIENAAYEQSFKLGDDERFADMGNIERLLDAAFMERVAEQFKWMHQNKLEAMQRHFAQEEQVWETII